jgi:predicted TIM-barrel fold metal-dependent hydrolase
MSRNHEDDSVNVPFPTSPVSNGEWCPLPITDKQRLAATLIADECAQRARRHGMSRAQFLRTAAATATAFMVLNKVYGLDSWGDAAAMPVRPEHCDDLDAARELLDRRLFVMDVQQHHVDLTLPNPSSYCFLRFREKDVAGGCPANLGQQNFVKEVFVDSETDVGVISGLPFGGIPLGPKVMAETRDLVNELAGSERCLAQAVCDPTFPPGGATSVDSLEVQVHDRGARALKCYTYSGNWRLDDEAVSYPMLTEASRLGLGLVNVHKGLPAIFAPGSPEYVRTTDFPKVVHDWPQLKFCAYHSGYFQAGSHPVGLDGLTEFLQMIQRIPPKERRRVYAEIGSSFAIVLSAGPDQAAHFIGQLLKALGPKNILWGTDSIWWGSPQWLIDAFKNLQIPASMQQQFGYPALTEHTKHLIFGLNAARLYGVRPRAQRCTIPTDRLAALQDEQGGPRAGRSLRWYGPQTRRGFLSMLRLERQLG